MRWLKRERWKAGIALAVLLLLLVLIVWVSVSAAGAYEGTSGLATLVTVQATPTEDPTVTELNKQKLEQDVQHLKYQNEQLKYQNAPDFFGLLAWLRMNAITLLTTVTAVVGGLVALLRWLAERRREREKQTGDRFQDAVAGLVDGKEKEDAQIAAAIALRTFLHPGYEQFYIQVFDLAVAHLCLPITSQQFRQTLTAVFTEAFPLARKWIKLESWLPWKIIVWLKRGRKRFDPRDLDATNIHLDQAFLWKVDLKQAWMPKASLQKTDFSEADLRDAKLWEANLSEAKLVKANLRKADLGSATLCWADLSEARLSEARLSGARLSEADLSEADLSEADLGNADLSRTILRDAKLTEAKLSEADLGWADLGWADLSGADLSGADLSGADLSGADLSGADLSAANLFMIDSSRTIQVLAKSLQGTILYGVKGPTKEQLAACKAKGASTDEASPTTLVTSAQVSILFLDSICWGAYSTHAGTTPVQVNTPPPDTDGRSTTSSKLDSASEIL